MKHLHYTSLDSTQDEILNHVQSYQDEDYFLVSTDNQTKGRGRHNRTWEQTKGGLFLSMVLPPANTITLTTLEISALICRYFNDELKVKWPNDIYTSNMIKCAGILIDIKYNKLIAGIGINTQPNKDFGNINIKEKISNKNLATIIAQYISENRLDDSEIINTWNSLCVHLNADVEIIDQGQSFFGKFIGIGLNGQAILKIGDDVKEFYSGSLKLIS